MHFVFVAKKYLVYPLILYCDEFLFTNLNAENVFSVLQYTIDCEADTKLKEKCVEIICTKTKDVLKSEEFLKISSKCLMFLLDQDSLNVSEAELFNAVSSSSLLLLIAKKLQIKYINYKLQISTDKNNSLNNSLTSPQFKNWIYT